MINKILYGDFMHTSLVSVIHRKHKEVLSIRSVQRDAVSVLTLHCAPVYLIAAAPSAQTTSRQRPAMQLNPLTNCQ